MHKFLLSLEGCFSVGGLKLFSPILCYCNLETQMLKIIFSDNVILLFLFKFRFFFPGSFGFVDRALMSCAMCIPA